MSDVKIHKLYHNTDIHISNDKYFVFYQKSETEIRHGKTIFYPSSIYGQCSICNQRFRLNHNNTNYNIHQLEKKILSHIQLNH